MPTDVTDGRPAQQPTRLNCCQVAVVRSRSIRKKPMEEKIDARYTAVLSSTEF